MNTKDREKAAVTSKSQLTSLVKSGLVHEAFTHTTEGVFDITEMRNFALKCKKIVEYIPIDDSLINFVKENRDIDYDRVASLSRDELNDPCMVVAYPEGEMLIIDGGHRIIRQAQLSLPTIPFWVFEPSEIIRPANDFVDSGIEWGAFEIVDGQILPHDRTTK